MKHPTFNYVRTHRQRHALNEQDLADLLGQRSGSVIAMIEGGNRVPTLENALALQVVFGAQPKDMFPGLYEGVEETVMCRAKELHDRLEVKADPRSAAKRELLEEMSRRSDDPSDL